MCIIFDHLSGNGPIRQCNQTPRLCEQSKNSQKTLFEELTSLSYQVQPKSSYSTYEDEIDLICPNGHTRKIRPVRWARQRNVGCPLCEVPTRQLSFRRQKLQELFDQSKFKTQGYTIVIPKEEEINLKAHVTIICPNDHEYKVLPYYMKKAGGCKQGNCAGRYHFNARPQAFYENVTASRYSLAEGQEFINGKTFVELICPNRNIYRITPDSFNSGTRCNCVRCRLNKQHGMSKNLELIEAHICRLNFSKGDNFFYHGLRYPIDLICPSGDSISYTARYFLSKKSCTCDKCTYKALDEHELLEPHQTYLSHVIKRIKAKSTLTYQQISECLQKDELLSVYNSRRHLGFQIDHVIPFRFFNMNEPDEVKMCWDVENLQQLTVFENNKKSGRIREQDCYKIKSSQKLLKFFTFLVENNRIFRDSFWNPSNFYIIHT
ncbi:MAG: hypothetical protein ACRCXZ_08140 [Patescibacteria group bacterium]